MATLPRSGSSLCGPPNWRLTRPCKYGERAGEDVKVLRGDTGSPPSTIGGTRGGLRVPESGHAKVLGTGTNSAEVAIGEASREGDPDNKP